MKKYIIFLFSLYYLSACSMFIPSKQRVSILTSQTDAKIYANGEFISIGQQAEFYAKRNHDTQIMVISDGFYPSYKHINSELSVAGILDIIGGVIWLVPFIGLAFPGSKKLDTTNVAVNLVPKN